MNRLTLFAALPLLALAACGNADNSAAADGKVMPVVAADPICRPTANGRKVTACYLTLVSPQDDRLVSIQTPAAARASVHETTMESNMMMMRPVQGGIALAAGQAIVFAPGGNHIMLNDVKTPLAVGDTVELTLTFEKAPDLTLTAPVGQPPEVHSGAHG